MVFQKEKKIFRFQFGYFKSENNFDNSGDYIIEFPNRSNANIQCWLS